jgi:hypothetical protein
MVITMRREGRRQEIPVPPEYIKWLREEVFRMSLVAFGNIWGVSGPAVHRWEAGLRHPAGDTGTVLLGAIKTARQMVVEDNRTYVEAAEEILRLKRDEFQTLFKAAHDSEPLSSYFGKLSDKGMKHALPEQGQQRRAEELQDLLNRTTHHLTERERSAISEITPRLLWWMVDSLWMIIGRGRIADRDRLLASLEKLATDVEEIAEKAFQSQSAASSASEELPASGEEGPESCD